MQLLVFTVVGLTFMVVLYALGWGGAVSFLIFLAVLLIGILVRTAKPLIEQLRP